MNQYSRTLVLSLILASSLLLPGCVAVVATGAAAGAAIMHDRRTTGTIIEDQSIELKAKKTLSGIVENIENTHISVISYNNVLLLVGQVPDHGLHKEIVKTAYPEIGNTQNQGNQKHEQVG